MSDDATAAADPEGPEDKRLLDRLRDSGVGTQDPNIVGDAGPDDIPPGADLDGGQVFTEDDEPEPTPEG